MGCLITVRPYIKTVVNEIKFTYVAEEYKDIKKDKLKKTKKIQNKKKELVEKKEFRRPLKSFFI